MEGRKQNTFTKEERTSDILRIKKSSLLPSSLCPNWGTWGRLEMKLPRPNYTQLDPFFGKKRGGLYISEQGFFFGVTSVTFLGPGNGLSKMRGVFQKGGGILCFGMFF